MGLGVGPCLWIRAVSTCPCGSDLDEAACCGRWLSGNAAPTAEALMRSRYTAYVRQRADYLLQTWHPDTRPPAIDFEPGTKWLGLSVKSARDTGPDTADVVFVARYKIGGGSAVRLAEHSRFRWEKGRWYYVDAV